VPQTVLREKGQLTIPAAIRKATHLEEGDSVDVSVIAEGILLRPRKTIDSTQAWFWTPAWQKCEHGASEDLRRGRVHTYKSDEDFLQSFEE
jgi:AbrB family looped-hinge helix DNA binding protein